MKGIILAGGIGTRLYPLTLGVCKQLLPIYDKPMIYYPLSTLMLAGIREILIISTPLDISRFKSIFGEGSFIGLKISYATQYQPKGIAESFIIGEKFIGKENVCLILGDNIFFGHNLTSILRKAREEIEEKDGGIIFGYYVDDPQRYGIIEFDKRGKVKTLKEKPEKPKSNYAQTGLYFYDNKCIKIAKNLKPSDRGELEITDLNIEYLKKGKLKVRLLGRGFAWLDTGTPESMLEASDFIQIIEKRQGHKIGCIEEVAYRMGYIARKQLLKIARPLMKSGYGKYLLKIAEEDTGMNYAF